MTNNIHDSGYKKLFSNKTIFRQLIETFVTENWVKELDFDNCETIDKSFISAHYKETESDLIYKLKLKNRDVYFYILMEFQSGVDYFMALRLLNYITNFYMDYVFSNKNVKILPPIFPIMLYNGDRKWDAPVNIADLIEGNALLGKYAINFEYFKISENEYGKEALLKIRNIVSTLFLAESHYDVDALKEELLSLFENEEDKQAVSLFLNWFKQLSAHGKIDPDDYKYLENAYKSKEEVTNMLITALEREKKKTFKKGKLEGKLEDARIMLSKGMEKSLISEITGLSIEEIDKLK